MRPDEHKKKRSAQYKKKHGLTKESGDKQEGKVHKDRTRSGASLNQKSKPNIQHEKSSKESGASNSQKRLSSSSSSDSEEEITQQKTYSRRKLVSNWDRYDIPAPEEDKVEHRGEDFTKLLHSAGDAVSQFRFQDEQGWEEDGNISVGSEFLSVDVNHLATSLDCLPLYDRLGLDKNLFSEEQLVEIDNIAMQNKEFYKSTECNSTNTAILSSINSVDDTIGISSETSNSDSKQIRHNKTDNVNDLSRLLPTKLKVSSSQIPNTTLDTCPSETNDTDIKPDGVKIAKRSENVMEQSNSIIVKSDNDRIKTDTVAFDKDTSSVDKSTIEKIDSAEDELDFLLSLDKPSDVTNKGDNSQVVKSNSQHSENKSNVVTLETKRRDETPPVKEVKTKTETENLEDWLDSVLDD